MSHTSACVAVGPAFARGKPSALNVWWTVRGAGGTRQRGTVQKLFSSFNCYDQLRENLWFWASSGAFFFEIQADNIYSIVIYITFETE